MFYHAQENRQSIDKQRKILQSQRLQDFLFVVPVVGLEPGKNPVLSMHLCHLTGF